MEKMLAILPRRFSINWLILYLAMIVVLWGALVACNMLLMNVEAGIPFFKGMAIIAAVVSLVPCLFGFFNAKAVYLLTSIGIIVGLCLLIYHFIYTESEGGLIGMSAFFGSFVCGLALGILLQIVLAIVRRK